MRWRDIFIGAIVTLAITVIGGVVVYYVTKEPSKTPPSEILVYQSDTAAKFTSDTTKLSFQQIRVGNIGNEVAQNVLVSVSFSTKAKIKDTNVIFSSGNAAGEYNVKQEEENSFKLAIATLTPGENITIAMLIDVVDPENPTVAVKSSKSVGSNMPLVHHLPPDDKKKTSKAILSFLIPLALVGQFFLLFWFRNAVGGPRSLNNIAFMYIHSGLSADAKEMLRENIFTNGGTSYELANYGICLGLDGDSEKAEKNFKAAEFYAPGSHVKGLVSFYRGILSHRADDKAQAIDHFKKALSSSGRRIRRYSKFSKIMESIFESDQDIKELFKV